MKVIQDGVRKKLDVVIVRENVSLTNSPDTSYLNLKLSRGNELIQFLSNGGKVAVVFKQYETIHDKNINKTSRVFVKYVESLEQLGLRANVDGHKYYRYRINGLLIEKSRAVDSKFKIGTAFSGLGCPEFVLNKLNVEHSSEYVIENNKFAKKTLIQNYNPKKVLSDITQVDTSKLPSVDLYVFGSPCENFSMAAAGSTNGRTGLNGPTGNLFWDGFRVIRDTLPKFFIFENTSGIKSVNGGEDLETIKQSFEDLGHYKIYSKIINPLDIGGATNRCRFFTIGVRKDIKEKYQFPKEESTSKVIKDFLIDGVIHDYEKYSNDLVMERAIEKQRGRLKKDFKWYGTKRETDQRVFNINYPAPTITRSCHLLINDGVGVRKTTLDELKAIQGFDDGLSFEGISNTQIKSQLGNTMEVITMRKLIGEIVRIYNSHMTKKSTNNYSVNNIKYSNEKAA